MIYRLGFLSDLEHRVWNSQDEACGLQTRDLRVGVNGDQSMEILSLVIEQFAMEYDHLIPFIDHLRIKRDDFDP